MTLDPWRSPGSDPTTRTVSLQYVDVVNAARAVDSPWQPPDTLKRAEGRFRYGWDGEVETPFLGLVEGQPVAVGRFAISEWDNRHLAWLGVQVHPDHRRRGYGSQVLDALVAETKAHGRTSVGIDGWESEGVRAFAARHGLEEKSRAIQRRQLVAELDWPQLEKLHAEASAAATAYEIVRREGRTPDDELEAVAEMSDGDQRRPHRRPRHRGRGLLAGAGPRLRGGAARQGPPAVPRPGPAPGERRAGRPHRGGRRGGAPRARRAARHLGRAAATAATGSGCCSRPT